MSRRRGLSAGARVQLAMTSVLVASLAALVTLAYTATARQMSASTDDLLAREAESYSAAVAGAPSGAGVVDATRAYLERRTGGGSGFAPVLFVRLTTGRVLSNSDAHLEDAVPADTGSESPAYRTVRFRDTTYRVLAVPVSSKGAKAGTFVAAMSEAPSRETASGIALTLTAAGAFALAVGIVLSYLATRGALRPLTRMAAEVSRISHNQPGTRIGYDGPADELGSLARSLNSMIDRLQAAYDEQKRFIADASHELRTPVAVIRGNVELLEADTLDAEGSRESLEMIRHETERMVRLLDDLLALARTDGVRLRLQPLEVGTLVGEVAARARMLTDRVITSTADCDVWVEGDSDLLDQALANLVRNAIAHTGPEGHIDITCAASQESVNVTVTDDGAGIPEGDMDRIFDRFYRAPGTSRADEGGGAGLGLAITRQLVELHSGTITAGSAEPRGARFVVTLPRASRPDDLADD